MSDFKADFTRISVLMNFIIVKLPEINWFIFLKSMERIYYGRAETSVVALSKAGIVCRHNMSGRMTFLVNATSEETDLGYSMRTNENHVILSCVLSDDGVFVMHESDGRLTRLICGIAPSFIQTSCTADAMRLRVGAYGSNLIIGTESNVVLFTCESTMKLNFDAKTIDVLHANVTGSVATYRQKTELVIFDPKNKRVSDGTAFFIPPELEGDDWNMALSFGERNRTAILTDTAIIIYDGEYACIGAIRISDVSDITDTFNETIAAVTFYGVVVQIDADTMTSTTMWHIPNIVVAAKNNYAASTVLTRIGPDLVVNASTIGLGLGMDTSRLYCFDRAAGPLEKQERCDTLLDVVEYSRHLDKKGKQDIVGYDREDDDCDAACGNPDEAGDGMLGVVYEQSGEQTCGIETNENT